jgi:hypothetical protein
MPSWVFVVAVECSFGQYAMPILQLENITRYSMYMMIAYQNNEKKPADSAKVKLEDIKEEDEPVENKTYGTMNQGEHKLEIKEEVKSAENRRDLELREAKERTANEAANTIREQIEAAKRELSEGASNARQLANEFSAI